MAEAARKPILIAGGGLASLLLAQALRRAAIPFVVFEKDASLVFRAQGYRLRLSTEGLDAIESVLDPALFQTFWEACGKTAGGGLARIDAMTGSIVDAPGSDASATATPAGGVGDTRETLTSRDGKTVGISRGEMRKIFLTGCEPYVQWSTRVTGYEVTPTGVHAIFADGSKSVEGDLLVGGEGIYSAIAKQVSHGRIKTFDTGARGIHGQAPTSAYRALGEGVFRLSDDSRPQGLVNIITNVRPGELEDETQQFGWTMNAAPGIIQAPNDNYSVIGKPAADMAKALTADWHPSVRALTDQMVEAEAAFWKITCSSPSGVPEWPNEPRVTVIGDAAHSMTPAAGIGANTAVRDSALLGRLLAEHRGYRAGITAAYEAEMRVYASQAVHTSYTTATKIMGIRIDEKTTPTVN